MSSITHHEPPFLGHSVDDSHVHLAGKQMSDVQGQDRGIREEVWGEGVFCVCVCVYLYVFV